MPRLFFALALMTAACTPATAPEPTQEAAAPAEAPDFGPYTNNWNSNEFSRFTHVLYAAAPGEHTLTLAAHTNSPGGETVAVYPLGPDGEPLNARIMFVIATYDGDSETSSLHFPETGEGVPVMVVVESQGERAWAGSYTLTVSPQANE